MEATLNYGAPGSVLDASDVAGAVEYANKVAEIANISSDANKVLNVNSDDTVSATVSPQALVILASNDMSLNVASQAGSLTYDKDALGTFAKSSGEVTVSMEKDDVSQLNDVQKNVIADATFVSVKAMAGDDYISDIGGTVAMTSVFENSKHWENFGAFYVGDDGSRTPMDFSFDVGSNLITVYSTHHSVYAILEAQDAPEGDNCDNTVLLVAGCAIAAIVIGAAAVYLRRS